MNTFTNLLTSVLEFINGMIHNYGWSIVVFTILFRLALSPLDFISRRSMKRMSDLNPQLNELQKKYANDRDKLARKQQDLYKANGVSPFAGCLPMLIQLPLFFAFFAAIRTVSANEMFKIYETVKQTGDAVIPSFYWVHNLWAPDNIWSTVIPAFNTLSRQAVFANVTDYDTVMAGLATTYQAVKNGYLILPVIATLLSYWQSIQTQKYNPQPVRADGKSTNGMMKWMMPVMSLFFCSTSSAAFSLYWIASSLAAIGTTWLIQKILVATDNKKRAQALEAAANPVIDVPETRRERRERLRREAEEAAANEEDN